MSSMKTYETKNINRDRNKNRKEIERMEMSWKQFYNLPAFDYDEKINLQPGLFFLMGDNMTEQIFDKEPGDWVSVYEVLQNDKDGVSFIERRIKTYHPNDRKNNNE